MGFSKDFLWGAASSAHQIEGAFDEDGKGAGIWDALGAGHVKHGDNGNIACDHYHRFREDVALMKKIGLKSYRFSVSWPRVMPEKGKVNNKALRFYSDLVDELVRAGIEPMVTLFHWNLPMWAHAYGGWENEKVVEDFEEYTKVVIDALSNRVTYWMTINEPQCFIGFGYIWGTNAPFLQKPEALPFLTRNVMLSHGKAVKIIRKHAQKTPLIGFAPTGSGFTPKDSSAEAIERAREKTYTEENTVIGNSWWMDPIILGKLPNGLKDYVSQRDLKEICQPLDFFACNIYCSQNYTKESEDDSFVYPGMPRNTMDWSITPEVMYWMPKFHYERYHLPVLISENGMPNIDFVMLDGKVHDPQRIDYIKRYIQELKRAADEGIPVIGYQYWSILDNYEWAEGYDRRFGLIYVDYRTQKRTLKDSAYAYAEIIQANGDFY